MEAMKGLWHGSRIDFVDGNGEKFQIETKMGIVGINPIPVTVTLQWRVTFNGHEVPIEKVTKVTSVD